MRGFKASIIIIIEQFPNIFFNIVIIHSVFV